MRKRLRRAVRRSGQKLAAGLSRARALLERERVRHSVLSESFLVITRLEERLDEELRKVRRGLTAVRTAASGALPRAP